MDLSAQHAQHAPRQVHNRDPQQEVAEQDASCTICCTTIPQQIKVIGVRGTVALRWLVTNVWIDQRYNGKIDQIKTVNVAAAATKMAKKITENRHQKLMK